MSPGEDFIPQICKLKHDSIDKDISEIKEEIVSIRHEENKQHKEIKEMMVKLSGEIRTSHLNLKNKIVLVNKTMGDKIDELNDFDEKLRGNGDPGIWESVRNIKRNMKIILGAITIIIILVLGGNYRGVSVDSIKGRFVADDKPKIKIVEETPEIVIPTK